MSKRYRLYCVAAGGVLVAFAAGLHAQDHRERNPETAQPAQAEPKTSPSPSLPIIVTGPVRVERDNKPEPDWDKLKCGEAKSHEEADLCEQRRMAKAAEHTVQLNLAQIVVGIAGFLALLYSLRLNRQATTFAGNAAESSRQSVAAAIRAAEAAEKSAKSAEAGLHAGRAWLTLGQNAFSQNHHEVTGELFAYQFVMRWENTGQTPAVNCSGCLEYELCLPTTDSASYTYTGGRTMHSCANAGPNGASMITRQIPIEMFHRVKNKTGKLFIYTRIEYNDIFTPDMRRHSEQCMEIGISGAYATKVSGNVGNVFGMNIVGTQNTIS